MLRKLALVCAAALLTATAASAAGTATASLSNSSPGARDVAVTIVLHAAELQCGRLSAKSVSVSLPHAMHVPGSIPPATARVEGRTVTAVQTYGRTIVLTPAARHGITCDSIGPGTVRVQLGAGAGLRNPAKAGTYAFSVEAKPAGSWRGSFVVG